MKGLRNQVPEKGKSSCACTPTELRWPETQRTRAGVERKLPIPCHDAAGIVAEIGPGANGIEAAMPVVGLIDFSHEGAEAEYTLALPNELAPMPRSINFEQVVSSPVMLFRL